MANGTNAMRGIVHGKMIEIEGDLNLPEGQQVTVVVQPILSPEEAIQRSFGGWSDDPDGLDRFLAEMRQLRDLDRSEPNP
jgi:hypothetical protein